MSRNIEINIKQQNGEVTNYETLYPKTVSKNILYSGEDSVTVWDKLNNLTPSTTFEVGDILLTSKTINLGTNQWLPCDGTVVDIAKYPDLGILGSSFLVNSGKDIESNIYPDSLIVYGKNSGLYYALAADLSTSPRSIFFCKDSDDISNINNWKAVEFINFNNDYQKLGGIVGGEKIGNYYFFLINTPYTSSGGNNGYYYMVLDEDLNRKFLSDTFASDKQGGLCIWAGIIKESDVSYDVCFQQEGVNSSYPWCAYIYNINLTNRTWTRKTAYSSRINYLQKIENVYYAYSIWSEANLYSSNNLTNDYPSKWTFVSNSAKIGGVVGKVKDWYITSNGYCSKNYLEVFNDAQKFTDLINISDFGENYFWLQGNEDLVYYTLNKTSHYSFYSSTGATSLIYEFDFSNFPVLKRTLTLSTEGTRGFPGYLFINQQDNLFYYYKNAGDYYHKIVNTILSYQLPTIPTVAQITGATYYIKVGNDN